MTRALAGPSVVCKTIRAGFDSLPRLHVFVERKSRGIRFPQDYGKADLVKLALHHHAEASKSATEAMRLRERLVEAQKELSRLKRHKG